MSGRFLPVGYYTLTITDEKLSPVRKIAMGPNWRTRAKRDFPGELIGYWNRTNFLHVERLPDPEAIKAKRMAIVKKNAGISIAAGILYFALSACFGLA